MLLSVTTLFDMGQSNHGTLSGPVRTVGKLGQAINFDGLNDYVSFSTIALAGDFTISGWLKFSDGTISMVRLAMIFSLDSVMQTRIKFKLLILIA